MAKKSPVVTAESEAYLPLLDLFQRLRRAGMLLTIKQYELLRQALAAGYGVADWEDLRDICRLLWVKPSVNYDAEIFEREFASYEESYRQQFADWIAQQQDEVRSILKPAIELGVLPQIPPRRTTISEASPETMAPPATAADPEFPPTQYGIAGVKHDRPKIPLYQPQYVVDVPVQRAVVQQTWRMLRRPMPDGRLQELDVMATVEAIGRDGFFSDVVTRPGLQKKADLLLLVDDSNVMFPFMPVIQPLIELVLSRRIAPSVLYRFNQYPGDRLYDWHKPLRGKALGKVLGQLHQQRTLAVVVSDAGAASPLPSEDRLAGTGRFLARLLPCVREVLWLNPLPSDRWVGTTAAVIDRALAGRMVPFAAGSWQKLARTREFKAEVQLAVLNRREQGGQEDGKFRSFTD